MRFSLTFLLMAAFSLLGAAGAARAQASADPALKPVTVLIGLSLPPYVIERQRAGMEL